MNDVPYRFTEASCLRFQHVIAEIVRRYPEVVTIDPGSLSPETYSNRLRDAMTGLVKGLWFPRHGFAAGEPTKLIAGLRAIHPVSVAMRGNRVIAGPRKDVRRKAKGDEGELTTGNKPGLIIDLKLVNDYERTDVQRAIAVLHHYRVLTKPTKIVNMKPETSVLDNYDISIIEEADGFLIL